MTQRKQHPKPDTLNAPPSDRRDVDVETTLTLADLRRIRGYDVEARTYGR